MTDETDLTPEQEARVRRLLADARHADPAPEDVVARLDRVLADLAAEPAREATVHRLADRRRRAGTMLVAAAAVVVAGIGIGRVVGGGAGSADSESATAGSAADSADDTAAGAPQAEAQSGDGATAFESRREMPYLISEDQFADDARALRSTTTSALGSLRSESVEQYDLDAFDRLARARERAVCEAGDWGRGGYVSVLYDDAPGWVVIRPAQGDTQVADLFLCGSEQATRSVTLPVR